MTCVQTVAWSVVVRAIWIGVTAFAFGGTPAQAGPIGAAGDLYVANDQDPGSIIQYDGITGDLVGTFVSGAGSFTGDLEFGPNGNLFATSQSSPRGVREYDGSTGDLIGTLVDFSFPSIPNALTFTPSGSVLVGLVSGGSGSGHIEEFDSSTGDLLREFSGAPPGEHLGSVEGLELGPNGNLFVASSGLGILEFDITSGEFLDTFASGDEIFSPRDLTFGPNGNLFVSGGSNGSVFEYDGLTGDLIGTFASGGGLDFSTDLVFGPNGNLFVSNAIHAGSVIEFDGLTGAPIGTFASGGGLVVPAGLIFKPVPEPGVLALLSLGGFLVMRRRR